jgi:hypothetical protein
VHERLSNSPAIADVVRGMAARDAEFAARHGLKQRPDIQNLREVMGQPGWRQRLADMLQEGNIPCRASSQCLQVPAPSTTLSATVEFTLRFMVFFHSSHFSR